METTVTAIITFRKSRNSAAQFVYADDLLIGSVLKDSAWTTRGPSIRWSAFAKGRCIGSAKTRKEAAELLQSRINARCA